MDDPSSDDEALFLEAPDGRIEFTAEGRDYFAPWFGYSGIDIRQIKTREELDSARHRAFPYFFDWMAQCLRKRPQTLETRALLAIVEDDFEALERIEGQLRIRERLTVVIGPSVGRPTRS